MKYYSKTHEYALVNGETARIGISAHAAKELGDITYVELPEVDHDLIVGDPLGVVESVKAASDVFSPVSGTVVNVNSALDDYPAIINESPEEDGWICELENIDLIELEDLMSEEDYLKLIDNA